MIQIRMQIQIRSFQRQCFNSRLCACAFRMRTQMRMQTQTFAFVLSYARILFLVHLHAWAMRISAHTSTKFQQLQVCLLAPAHQRPASSSNSENYTITMESPRLGSYSTASLVLFCFVLFSFPLLCFVTISRPQKARKFPNRICVSYIQIWQSCKEME